MAELYALMRQLAGVEDEIGIERLEEVYDSWITTGEPKVEDPNIIINATGVALGQLLSAELQIDWCIYEDQHGNDLALHTPTNDVLLFPISSVAKRFERRETEFLVDLFEQVVQEVRRVRGS